MLPADAPLGGQAASILLSRLEDEPSAEAVVGVDAHGREQPLQLALRPAAARGIAGSRRPGWCRWSIGAPAARCAPTRDWSSKSWHRLSSGTSTPPDQLLAWRLRSSPAVSSILDLAAERQAGGLTGRLSLPLTAQAVRANRSWRLRSALRSGASVVEGDDFYRNTLPRLGVAQREAMSDAAVVDAVIDWERLRAKRCCPCGPGSRPRSSPTTGMPTTAGWHRRRPFQPLM